MQNLVPNSAKIGNYSLKFEIFRNRNTYLLFNSFFQSTPRSVPESAIGTMLFTRPKLMSSEPVTSRRPKFVADATTVPPKMSVFESGIACSAVRLPKKSSTATKIPPPPIPEAFAKIPKLKGSIGEGPNHSNFSDRSSVRILGIEILSKFRNFR